MLKKGRYGLIIDGIKCYGIYGDNSYVRGETIYFERQLDKEKNDLGFGLIVKKQDIDKIKFICARC